MEKMHLENGVEDSIYVLSTLLDNKETQSNSQNFFPFDHLYKQKFIPQTKIPRKPILISRNSASITLKLPPYQPIIKEDELNAEEKSLILSMAIFGKVSANGVGVSETSNDLHNTGVRQKIGQVVTIKNLL